ncbi:DUF2294 family protein [Iocasia frigidifontis]|uniref:DUF2294 family protein n=1 Tax=Iocasia fonsfrigidae TaxID=2682810 RepID=A0A8A7KCM3_9FIRM|nr:MULTISPECIES: DUF2294 domain-containing protein [Halanaerobiaceae]AZO93280.1 DUF2294 domain-containing protein [Halocella sp. SP3-1]QTL99536.1 DUF2294 family protein [Iocasia fonsfrigidae]
MNKSKGQIEAEISELIMKFEKEYIGRGPQNIKTYIIHDNILVKEKGVLTMAEQQLAKEEDGIKLIKQLRVKLIENSREILATLIKDITTIDVLAVHSDISTENGERIIVFSLSDDLEKKLKIKT